MKISHACKAEGLLRGGNRPSPTRCYAQQGQFQQHDQRRIAGTTPGLCVTLETTHAGSIMARPQSPLMAKFTAEFHLII